LRILQCFLEDVHAALGERAAASQHPSGWRLVDTQPNTPQQIGIVDCGVFVCLAVSFLSEGLPLTYTQRDIPRVRRMIARDLLRGYIDSETT
tara:strand:+ start:593 stop:868 length:276 start_codon:yes stop_codon:yes gene_type:complete